VCDLPCVTDSEQEMGEEVDRGGFRGISPGFWRSSLLFSRRKWVCDQTMSHNKQELSFPKNCDEYTATAIESRSHAVDRLRMKTRRQNAGRKPGLCFPPGTGASGMHSGADSCPSGLNKSARGGLQRYLDDLSILADADEVVCLHPTISTARWKHRP